jgi:cell division protein FtsI/penicillin-binding protein 2
MNDYTRTIEARLKWFGVVIIIVVVTLFWKMYVIQILQYDKYTALAQGQQRFETTEMGQRGRILVHDSPSDPTAYYPLAFDQKKFAVWVVPRQVSDKETVAKSLGELLSIPEKDIFDEINNDKLYIPPIKHGLTLDEANNIKDKKFNGVLVVPEYSRYYPEETLASQVLGFVNAEGQGMYGFEGKYNAEMQGKEGDVKGEKDTLGRVISLLEQQDPQDGTSYVLTIDRSVQYFVEKKLSEAITKYQADSGTVIIMDIKTGGIVAMASSPTFDPNNYQDQAKIDANVFMNPAISYTFEPGSIFKPIVMAAAIDDGLVTKDTSQTFGESIDVGGYTIHTAEGKAFGLETMTQVLENSDNVGMVWVAEQIGNEVLNNQLKKFGLYDKTGIDLEGEISGHPAYPVKDWKDINRATIAFGQGITVTPLQILTAYATIANSGKYIYPHLVDKIIMPDGTEKSVPKQEGEQVISVQTAKDVGEMLRSVVLNGTGKKANVPGYKVAAKTGTAQIADPVNGGYLKNDSGLGIFIHTAAGFAPVDDPQYAMLVKLDKPKTNRYAESTAVPLFGEISSFLLNYHYRIAPTEAITK